MKHSRTNGAKGKSNDGPRNCNIDRLSGSDYSDLLSIRSQISEYSNKSRDPDKSSEANI